jgi:uncharacterized coiled-coil protein SlyX
VLDEVVRSLNAQMAQLRREVSEIRHQIRPLPEARKAKEDVPPHYGR